jgi:hypothetical protein
VQTAACNEAEAVDKERQLMEEVIQQLKQQVTQLLAENSRLQRKYERSRSRKSKEGFHSQVCQPAFKSSEGHLGKDELSLAQRSNLAVQG